MVVINHTFIAVPAVFPPETVPVGITFITEFLVSDIISYKSFEVKMLVSDIISYNQDIKISRIDIISYKMECGIQLRLCYLGSI